MKRIFLTLALLVVVPLISVSTAEAGILQNRNNRIDYLNWETFGADGGAPGILEVGDTLRGIVQAQTMGEGVFGAADTSLIGAGVTSLTGIFEVEVIGVTAHPILPGLFYYEFAAHAPFAARNGLSAGAVMAYYVETLAGPQDFTNSLVTHAANEAFVTNGTLLGDFGFTGGGDEYWLSGATSSTVPPPGLGSSTFEYGLSYLGLGSLSSVVILPQVNPYFLADEILGATLLGRFPDISKPFDLVGAGKVVATPPGSLPLYDVASLDPALIHTVPEPSSLLVFAGLFGVGALISRRKKLASKS